MASANVSVLVTLHTGGDEQKVISFSVPDCKKFCADILKDGWYIPVSTGTFPQNTWIPPSGICMVQEDVH